MRANDLMLEVTPPSRLSSEKAISNSIEKIAAVVSELPSVNLLNIPEIIDENHEGKPFYRNMDTRDFGVMLRNATGKDVVVNKVTVHCNGEKDFSDWLEKTVFSYRIKNLVFVGGSNGSREYPGPSVKQANSEAKKVDGASIGNICIPSRENEVERLVAKTASGCSFFTTQILFECKSMTLLLEKYSLQCEKNGLEPAVFFLSFAPASKAVDVEFFKWLGAAIPSEVEQQLSSNEELLGSSSVELARRLYECIRLFVKEKSLNVPIALNVESITPHNLELAKELISTLENP